jgi:predicted DNA-binding transcriptional regulator AlpA
LAGLGVSTLYRSNPVDLLSLDHVVDLTGLSRSSLAKKRCDGSGPAFFKIGRTIKYAAGDVDAWILSRRRTSTWAANDNVKPSVAA